MPKYEVTYTVEIKMEVQIEAEDENEARQLVEDGEGDFIHDHFEENVGADRTILEVKEL